MHAALAESSANFNRKGYVMTEIQGLLSSSLATPSKHRTRLCCVNKMKIKMRTPGGVIGDAISTTGRPDQGVPAQALGLEHLHKASRALMCESFG